MTDTIPNVPGEGDEDLPKAEYVGTENVDATHAGEASDEDDVEETENQAPSYKRADDSIWD